MKTVIKVGSYYQGKLSGVIVKALSHEIRNSFQGIVIQNGSSSSMVGEVSDDWCAESFYEIEHTEQSNHMFPIY